MNVTSALLVRIRAYLMDIDRVVQRAIFLSEKAIQSDDDGYWDGVALNLHGFYSGVERCFDDIARTLDGTIPSGGEWHNQLLTQVSSEFDRVRPAVISNETRYLLDEYRGFRHVVRNVYAFHFNPDRLNGLINRLPACHMAIKGELESFCVFLENITIS